MRTALSLLILLALSGASMADDAAPKSPPALDMSRAVTLTGYELQALLRAQAAASEAQAAASAAAPATAKVNAALAPSPEAAPAK